MKGFVNLTHTNNGKINELGDKIDNLTKNAQSDWEQTDESALDYIKNKPIIPEGSVLYPTTGQHTDGAMTQKAVTTELNRLSDNVSQLSNPNLLINGDFSINQRGQSSYSEFANKYCVDRWRTSGNSVTVTPMDYGCSVSVGGTGQYYSVLEQIIEDYASLIGKPVTLSANIKSVSVNLQPYQYSIRIRCYDTNNEIIGSSEDWITTAGNYSCTFTVPSNTAKVSCLLYKNKAVDCTFEIEYMKLEIGSVATPFSPRPYAEELAMCQRYYQIRSNSYTIQPNAIDRPIPMRVDGTIGTITINETTYNYVDAEIYQ